MQTKEKLFSLFFQFDDILYRSSICLSCSGRIHQLYKFFVIALHVTSNYPSTGCFACGRDNNVTEIDPAMEILNFLFQSGLFAVSWKKVLCSPSRNLLFLFRISKSCQPIYNAATLVTTSCTLSNSWEKIWMSFSNLNLVWRASVNKVHLFKGDSIKRVRIWRFIKFPDESSCLF